MVNKRKIYKYGVFLQIKMETQLDVLLENLHSDENRLRFLRGIYTPGNVEVAERILAISEDSSVIEDEMTHAKKAGDTDRFRSMAKKYIENFAKLTK